MQLLVIVRLRVQIKIIVLFALVEELRPQTVLASLKILPHLELLAPQLVDQVDAALRIVHRHLLLYYLATHHEQSLYS